MNSKTIDPKSLFGISISAPSGTGKTTIISYVKLKMLDEGCPAGVLVSGTTRKKRPNEIHGKHYFFMTPNEFRNKIDNGEFLEYEEVYKDLYYGTLYSEFDRVIKQERQCPIFDLDVKGGQKLKQLLGENILSILIIPEDMEQLRKQIITRDPNNIPKNIDERLLIADKEIERGQNFADHLIVNKSGKLMDSVSQITGLCKTFVQKRGLYQRI